MTPYLPIVTNNDTISASEQTGSNIIDYKSKDALGLNKAKPIVANLLNFHENKGDFNVDNIRKSQFLANFNELNDQKFMLLAEK